jgi:dihydrofolate synthase/folylpolyglutamate synthase
MTYSEALAWLYSTQHHGIKLGLDNIRSLLKELGVQGANLRIIHVAGTNGKGSVCAMLDSICRAHGYCTGLYTSPHLVDFRERIRVNGQMISEESAAAGLTRIRQIAAGWEHSPTFFEIVTALALAYFEGRVGGSHPRVEVVILETGLGGRLDATNAVTPSAVVLTPIDFDHQAYLGDTLASIAGEKAGIIKPGVPVASASQPEEAATVLRDAAGNQNAPIEFLENPLEGFEIGLIGAHQLANAALAVKALELARIEVSPESIRSGLRRVQWPGRFQRIPAREGRDIILDGAHNQAGAKQLAKTWLDVFGTRKATVILGILRDKDTDAICRALAPISERLIATSVRSERTCSPEEVRAAFESAAAGISVPIETATDLPSALAAAETSPRVLVTGSLFLVGEALAFFEGNQTRPSLQ